MGGLTMESEFTKSLNYLNQKDVGWYNKYIEQYPLTTIIVTLLRNLDNWLGFRLRGD